KSQWDAFAERNRDAAATKGAPRQSYTAWSGMA
ncbi:hypothetical protein Tco_1064290, partial [Tanacetum coccineum]